MPIYEYKCQKCGFKFEQLQKVSDKALVKCPNCEQNKLKKLISAPYFHLKGSGWYKTDYKKADDNKGIKDAKKVDKKSETEVKATTKKDDDKSKK